MKTHKARIARLERKTIVRTRFTYDETEQGLVFFKDGQPVLILPPKEKLLWNYNNEGD